jgi:hypothetical protein
MAVGQAHWCFASRRRGFRLSIQRSRVQLLSSPLLSNARDREELLGPGSNPLERHDRQGANQHFHRGYPRRLRPAAAPTGAVRELALRPVIACCHLGLGRLHMLVRQRSLVGLGSSSKPEAEGRRVVSTCLTGLRPTIAGLQTGIVPCKNGHVIVVQVPKSYRKPHMVVIENLLPILAGAGTTRRLVRRGGANGVLAFDRCRSRYAGDSRAAHHEARG